MRKRKLYHAETEVAMSRQRFLCPECGNKLSTSRHDPTAFVTCPHCKAHFLLKDGPPLDLRFSCPACDSRLVVDVRAAGVVVTCPECMQRVQVPKTPPGSVPPTRRPLLSKAEIDHLTAEGGETGPADGG
jgi:transcription elongation factor Elf1